MRCLVSSRFNMTALVLVPGTQDANDTDQDGNTDEFLPGHYESQQDPDSGAYIRVWVADNADPQDPTTPIDSGAAQGKRISCMARGMADGGIRVAGTGERWESNGIVNTVDFVTIKFPPDVFITRRDRITDIRNNRGVLLWREEEMETDARPSVATVFEVTGVTPIVDPFGNHVENSALLQRAQVQV